MELRLNTSGMLQQAKKLLHTMYSVTGFAVQHSTVHRHACCTIHSTMHSHCVLYHTVWQAVLYNTQHQGQAMSHSPGTRAWLRSVTRVFLRWRNRIKFFRVEAVFILMLIHSRARVRARAHTNTHVQLTEVSEIQY